MGVDVSTFGTTDVGVETAKGNTDYTVVHKFGRNGSVGTSFVPITVGGVWQTPQVSGATALRIKAGGDAQDIVTTGTGAWKVTIIGLDETGAEQTEELTTNGTSASTAGVITFMRIYRAYVSESGSYATVAAGSHADSITIENSAGGTDWLTIERDGFSVGQSEIGLYTVPTGKVALIHGFDLQVAGTKTADLIFFQRANILETSTPYTAMRIVLDFHGVEDQHQVIPTSPVGPFAAGTDIGFLGEVGTGTGSISVDFEIWLYDA